MIYRIDMTGGANMSDLSKDVLGAIKKRTGKNISEAQIGKIANQVKPNTLENEAELRKLVKSVAAMANIKMSDDKLNEVVERIATSGVNAANLETLVKLMSK